MLSFLFTKTPLAFLTQSLWRDEAFSYLLAKKSFVDIIFLTAKDFNPPLYYFILHIWMKLFGNSEIALRLLSVIFFWLTIYVAYLFLINIFKLPIKKSILFLLLFIFNPLLLYYAFEVRMYSAFTFFALLSFYSHYLKKGRLYLVSSVLGLYTHYFMFFVLACQFIYSKGLKRISILKTVLFFIPWLLFIYGKIPISNYTWVSFVKPIEFLHLPAIIFTGYEKDFHYLKTYEGGFTPQLFYLSLILILIITFGKNKKSRDLFSYLVIWTFFTPVIIFFITLFRPLYVPRYLIFSTVGLNLLLVLAYKYLPSILKFIAVLLFTYYVLNFLALKIKYQSKADLRKTIGEIKRLANKNDVLFVRSELDFFVVQYYFDENRVYIYGKTYQEIPDYVGKSLISKNKIATRLPRYPQKAFILNPDQTYDIQASY